MWGFEKSWSSFCTHFLGKKCPANATLWIWHYGGSDKLLKNRFMYLTFTCLMQRSCTALKHCSLSIVMWSFYNKTLERRLDDPWCAGKNVHRFMYLSLSGTWIWLRHQNIRFRPQQKSKGYLGKRKGTGFCRLQNNNKERARQPSALPLYNCIKWLKQILYSQAHYTNEHVVRNKLDRLQDHST